MRLVVFAAVIIPLLYACGSNQPSETLVQPENSKSQLFHKNALEGKPHSMTPAVPMDGRLRDQHMQMYVSVKIRQEQLRYEQEITYVTRHERQKWPVTMPANVQNAVHLTSSTSISPAVYEKRAIAEFNFNTQLYFWAKRTIREAIARSENEDLDKYKRVSSFEESVIAHNINMIQKYQNELRFAQKYKLQSSASIVKQAASREIAKQQTALFLEPSN